ncbi:hypothetical protein BKA69DRAFT_1124747 [Paraphysoderma sedebokerense]|nr:hypothetical protein BKA69DRAFT_1124747 [Paraphysoderma sedebokerense]
MNSLTDFAASLSVISALAVILNIGLLVIAKRTNLAYSVIEILIVSLLICDLVDAAWNFIFHVSIAASGRTWNILVESDTACKLNGFVNQLMSGCSVATLVLLAVERYIQICTHWNIKKSLSIKVLVGVQIGNVIWSLLPILFGSPFAVQPSQVYCTQDLTSNQLVPKILRTHFLSGINGAFVIIVGCYGAIIFRTLQSQKRLKSCVFDQKSETLDNVIIIDVDQHRTSQGHESNQSITSITKDSSLSDSSKESKPDLSSNSHHHSNEVQKAILLRTISICLLFALCWAVYDYNLLRTVITKKPVSAYLDKWGVYFIALHGILNPMLIVITDRRFRKPISSFFYFSKNYAM